MIRNARRNSFPRDSGSLDEITANLDAQTEAEVLQALKRVSANRTVLSISHRVNAETGRVIPVGE